MKKTGILLLPAIFLLAACSKQKEKTNNELVFGKWKWEQTVGFGIPATVAVPGEVHALEFVKPASFTATLNGTVTRGGTYAVKWVTSPYGSPAWVISFSDNGDRFSVSRDGDKLWLSAEPGVQDGNSMRYSAF